MIILKRLLCMLLILSIIGGYGTLASNGVPDDDPDDWYQMAQEYDNRIYLASLTTT